MDGGGSIILCSYKHSPGSYKHLTIMDGGGSIILCSYKHRASGYKRLAISIELMVISI